MQETTNITTLARTYKVTTRDVERRLKTMGIEPSNEVLMPSGRRFVLYDKAAAMKALEKAKETPSKHQEPVQDIHAELAEVKGLLSNLLDLMTKPT